MTTQTITKVKEETICQKDMIHILFGQNRTSFMQIKSFTKPTMLKTDNPYLDKVWKFSDVNCLVGYQYQQMVNNARKRQLSSDIVSACLDAGVPQDVLDAFNQDLDEIVEQSHQEFEFVSAGLPWGKYMVNPITGVKSRVLIDHTKKDKKTKELLPETYAVYAQLAILHTKDPVYKWIETGEELSEWDVAAMKAFFPKKKTEGARQELRKPYIIRTYKVENIRAFSLNKRKYIVE